jgi:tetratricopeptide (TPR) repeat protein
VYILRDFHSRSVSIVAVIFLTGLIASCSSSEKVANSKSKMQKAPPERELTEEQRINLRYLYVEGLKEKYLENYQRAIELFSQCIRIDGRNHAAMYEIALIQGDLKNFADAIFFARSAAELDKDNVWYSLYLGELYMKTGKFEQAEQVLKELHERNPQDLDITYNYASVLLYNGKLEETIRIYDYIESIVGVNPELATDKQKLYLRLGKTEKAALEIRKLIDKFPASMEYYSLLVELYQVNEMPDEAYEVIREMQEIKPESPYVYLALAEHYRSKNQKEKSFEQLKLAFGSIELDSDVKVRIITSYLPLVQTDEEMLEQAITLSMILAETHPGESIAQAIYGDFLMMKADYAGARQQYLRSLEIDENNFTVWQQLFICYTQLIDPVEFLKQTSRAFELYPDQALAYLFHGIALGQNDDHAEAVRVLTAGSKLVVDNDTQLFQFYTSLGDSYNELKDFVKSDGYFEKALEIDPDDPYLLNNYSYYLSLRGERLEDAERMSKRSNELQPGQASFQDTYGWILYRLGRYDDAKMWLERAMESGGSSSGTILEHLGDVYYQLGDSAKAVEFWEKARELGDASDFIDRKIADKKLYE